MKIYYNNLIEEIKNLVCSKAKFQKVMLLFDDYVSNLEISEIYRNIKEFCIYNQSNIENIDMMELNNGYRMIIYLCCTDSFLKTDFDKTDFINVFCPKDSALLPYFLSSQNQIDRNENFMILPSQKVDVAMISSVSLNQFLQYLLSVLGMDNKEIDLFENSQELTQQNILNAVQQMDKNIKFFDVEILKKCGLAYKELVLVDLILIDAFLVMIKSIKNQNLMLVDVYKSAKENGELIDKFYSLLNNDAVFNLIVLNYNCLFNFCENKKGKILNCLNVFDYSQEEVDVVMQKIKQFAKQDSGILAYLYLYNIFGV